MIETSFLFAIAAGGFVLGRVALASRTRVPVAEAGHLSFATESGALSLPATSAVGDMAGGTSRRRHHCFFFTLALAVLAALAVCSTLPITCTYEDSARVQAQALRDAVSLFEIRNGRVPRSPARPRNGSRAVD